MFNSYNEERVCLQKLHRNLMQHLGFFFILKRSLIKLIYICFVVLIRSDVWKLKVCCQSV